MEYLEELDKEVLRNDEVNNPADNTPLQTILPFVKVTLILNLFKSRNFTYQGDVVKEKNHTIQKKLSVVC